MITEKEIKKFIDDLKKKLESMVYGEIVITEEKLGPLIKIYHSNTTGFSWAISWFEFEHFFNYLGPDTYLDLISKRIIDEYKDSILKLIIKEG